FFFLNVIKKKRYIRTLDIPPGIAKNRAFSENLFVMMVGLATKTPTIVVGRPGSSKTLAMATVQSNLSSSSKNKRLTELGFEDFFVMSFQCSKLTTADLIQKRWDNAVAFQEKLKRAATNGRESDEKEEKKASSNASGEMATKVNRSVVLWLDEMGLAEQSPSQPLKVLHKLLEEEDRIIGFVGLSDRKLDAAKMNRMVLHQVTQLNDDELLKTAEAIICENSGNNNLHQELSVAVLKITQLYQNIMKDKQTSPFDFDFYGYRDFYSLASSLKYSCNVHNELTNDLLVEAVIRNFGGMTQQQTESFLFPKLARFFGNNLEQ
ncbi:hypothetical protein RFI_36513, partial [Reticulomyxa filosa]